MKIDLVTPAPPRSLKGNRVTAVRWARILRDLGHQVAIRQEYRGHVCDVLVALHARRSAESIERFRRMWPGAPLVLALTGTDVYGDLANCAAARRSLELASRIIVLQPLAADEVPLELRPKVRVVVQSAEPPRRRREPAADAFEVCVMGHLRPVKDPLRAAMAARQLPPDSRVRIVQLGAALTTEMESQARAEADMNPRYRWLGELPRAEALEVLAGCRLLVLSSHLEGGANVVSEALAAGVPIVSTRIPGSIGILGPDYPGYFRVGDTAALASLLVRAETDREFYAAISQWCRRLAPLVDPRRERESWARLLEELTVDRSNTG